MEKQNNLEPIILLKSMEIARSMGYYYRCTFNGVGIYEALKREVGFKWKEIKQDPRITWLPQPPIEYGPNNLSYFTKKGYNYFKFKTMYLVKEVAPQLESELKVEEFTSKSKLLGRIVYEDEFQVVTEIENNQLVESILNQKEIALLKQYKIL